MSLALRAGEVLKVVVGGLKVEEAEFLKNSRSCVYRAVAAGSLIRYAALGQREVAERLKVGSGAAVSQQLKRLKETMARDNNLAGTVVAIEVILRDLKASSPRNVVNLYLKG